MKYVEKHAVPAWSPILNSKQLLATGASGVEGALDLEIYSLNSSERSGALIPIGRAALDAPCRSIGWSDIGSTNPEGVIACGLSNGVVSLWDAARILDGNGTNAMLASVDLHAGQPVACLEFNPQKPTLLGTVGFDGSVQVLNIERPSHPDIFRGVTTTKHLQSEANCLAWNRKVQHILATASPQGLTVVWDLKNKKEVVTIKDPANRTRCSSISWNPDIPTQLLVSYNDDNNPCVQLWDMRNCSYPFREFQEHARGVTCASFCDADSNFIVSAGRDNRAICWSLHSGQLEAYSELNVNASVTKLDWSPHMPGYIAAATTSGTVAIQTITQRQTAAASQYPPKWLKAPCGVSFGFGGKLITFGSLQQSRVDIHVVPDDPTVVPEAIRFEQYLATDLRPFCASKVNESDDDHEKLMWNLISLLFDGPAARERISSVFGIQTSDIQGLAEKYLGRRLSTAPEPSKTMASLPQHDQPQMNQFMGDTNQFDSDQLDSLFSELAKRSEEEQAVGIASAVTSRKGTPRAGWYDSETHEVATDWSQGPEFIIKQSILTGDMSTAVECCIKAGRFADALFLAGGNPELWMRARDEYAKRQNDPFIRLVGYILCNDLESLVRKSDLSGWVETLAILTQYASPDSFGKLIELLGDRLEKELFDVRSAMLCYLACGSFDNTVRIWASMSHTQGSQSQALQRLVEMMSCLFTAVKPSVQGPVFSSKVLQYATLLANSGRISAAMRCLILLPESSESRILKDRIYNAAPTVMGQLVRSPPPFPFEHMDVRPVVVQGQPLRSGSMHSAQQPGVNAPGMRGHPQGIPAGPPGGHMGVPTPPSGMQRPGGNPPPNGHFAPPSGIPQHPAQQQPGMAPRISPPSASGPSPSAPPSNMYSASRPVSTGPPVSHPGSYSATPAPVRPQASIPVRQAHSESPSPVVSAHQGFSAPVQQPQPPSGGYHPSPAHQPSHIPSHAPPARQSHIPGPHVSSVPVNAPPAQNWNNVAPPMEQSLPPRAVVGPPSSGGVSTDPRATARPVTAGLPVSWPVPTPVQQQLSPGMPHPPVHVPAQSAQPPSEPVPAQEIASFQRALGGLLNHCAQDGNQRKWDDTGKKLNDLYERLASGQLSRESVNKIRELCACIERGDFAGASRLRVELSASDWEKNRTWLFAVQLLLPK